jgi:hypothetical protein
MSGGESNAEIDALMALGELAQAASYVLLSSAPCIFSDTLIDSKYDIL